MENDVVKFLGDILFIVLADADMEVQPIFDVLTRSSSEDTGISLPHMNKINWGRCWQRRLTWVCERGDGASSDAGKAAWPCPGATRH